MIARDIVHHREEQEPVVGLGQVVVGDLVGRAPLAGGDRGDAHLGGRLVVRRIAHDEELVPARGDELAELRQLATSCVGRLSRQGFAPQRRIAQALALLGQWSGRRAAR